MELNQEQLQAINTIDKNLQIVACAGSGKTEVISRRIVNILAKKNVNPKSIVAFTFTNLAADNMRARIDRIAKEEGIDCSIQDMYIGTIHSFCKCILDVCCDEFSDFRILDAAQEHLFIMKYFKKCGADDLGLYKNNRDIALFSSCFEKMVEEYENYNDWSAKDEEVFNKYRSLLHEKHFFNFALLIHEVLRRIDDQSVKQYISEIEYLIVDEYQDVNDLQEKLVYMISSHGANICVVGDDDQTIYQFRGSNAENMIHFQEKYEQVVRVNLNVNYRSGKEIIEAADTVIANNHNRIAKKMKANDRQGGSVVSGKCFAGIHKEYDALIEDIKLLHSKGIQYKDMSILIRKRKRINGLTDRLREAGIPFEAEENTEFFESKCYEVFCGIFKYLKDPSDENKLRIIGDWKTDCEPRQFKKAMRYLSRCGETNEKFSIMFEEYLNLVGFYENTNLKKYADAFIRILLDFDNVYTRDSWTVRTYDVNLFLERMVEEDYQKTDLYEKGQDDAIRVLTVHQAKGLEFDAVFIPDLYDGFFPAAKVGGRSVYSVLGEFFEQKKHKYEGTIEDERKLFYVALTRAKRYLYLYSDYEKKDVSEFLYELQKSTNSDITIPSDLEIKAAHNDGRHSSKKLGCPGEDYEEEDIPLWREFDLKQLRKDICDEFYAAAFVAHFGAAFLEANSVRKASDEELIRIAQREGYNLENYRKRD